MENNVKFCVFGTTYDKIARRNVVTETTTITNIEAYLEVVQPTLETEIVSDKDRERFIRERIIVVVQNRAKPYVVEGAYIGITHVRHEDSNMWIKATDQKQYKIATMTTSITPRMKSLGLLEADKE